MTPDATRTLAATSLADIVNADPRAAIIFDQFGLDYCCRGRETLDAAARKQGVPLETVTSEIAALGAATHGSVDDQWTDLAALVEHIVVAHHRYIRDVQPVIAAWLEKLVVRHGPAHPELGEVRDTFGAMSADLLAHMVKEEQILFPYIVDLSKRGGAAPTMCSPFGSVQNPIRAMEQEHLEAGDAFERLRALTRGFEPPEDACTTYRLCYRELARFERDLHRHVHLENHILFPRAVRLEQHG
jgi:regulator of cell morphogenesis and NO signaling